MKVNINTLISIVMSTLVIAGNLKAQEKEEASSVKKETVLVTASRTEDDPKKIGKSFTIITREEIEASRKVNIIDILRGVPGLHFNQNGPNGLTGVFIRGSESYHTKFLINGVPLDDAAGTQVQANNFIRALNTSNIERIEIIRGSQSVIHGSDSIGGVINIITRNGKGTEAVSGSIINEYGTHKYIRNSINLLGQVDKFNYSMSLTREYENGITARPLANDSTQDGDDYRNLSGDFQLGYAFNEFVSLNLSGNYIDSEVEYDAGELHSQQSTVRPELKFSNLFDGLLDTRFAFSHTDTRRGVRSSFPNLFEGEIKKYEWLSTLYAGEMNTITFGIDREEQRANSNSVNQQKIHLTEYFVEDQINFFDTFFLTLGGRLTEHSEFGQHETYQISGAYYIDSTGTKFHASFGTGFRAPSANELYGPFGADDTLEPEESESFDIGFTQQAMDGDLEFGATYFYSTVDNAIIYSNVSFQYETVPHIRKYGFESFLKWQVTEKFYTKITYTRLHTESQIGNNSDLRAARRPKNSGALTMNYQPCDKLNLNLDFNYNGSRNDYGFSGNEFRLKSYLTADFAVNFNLTENIILFGRVQNMFDEDYIIANGYNTLGRTFYAGVQYNF